MAIRRAALLSCLCLLLAACGSGSKGVATRLPLPTPTEAGRRLGVVLQGDMESHFLAIEVPDEWETGDRAKARYAIDFSAATEEIETCDYILTGLLAGQIESIIRERHDVTVTITDLAENQEYATRRFEGAIPEACPDEVEFRDGAAERFRGYPDATEFRTWLMSELGDAEDLSSANAALLAHRETVVSLVYDASGTHLATATEYGDVILWDAESGRRLWSTRNDFSAHPVFSLGNATLLTSSSGGVCKQWDVDSGNELLAFDCRGSVDSGASFSHDGLRILTSDRDGTLHIWDSETQTEILKLTGFEVGVSDAEFSPDDSRIAAIASLTDRVIIWNAETGEQLGTFEAPFNSKMIDFSPDGARLLIAGGSDNVVIVDATSGNGITSMAGSIGFIHDAVFSSDGLYVATASSDRSVRIWDAQTGAELLRLMGHTGGVTSVAFRPDGLRVAAGSEDQNVLIWDVSDLYKKP